ncbi:hypothetical protein [Dyella sp. 20L07]|uniref:hypothetical protein n=1 Tax=Dyella sp. 20L07 TaxID=3384240 RepID=UPI003D2C2BC5
MSRTYDDAYLNHWSDVFVARRAKRFGITLEMFLAQPEQMLNRLDRFEAAERTKQEPRPHRLERLNDAALHQRGDLLVTKIWQGSRRRPRHDKPLPGLVR